MSNKVRRVLAVIGLVCMAIFSVSLVIVLADRTLLGGAFGYLALVSGLLGISLFLVVKFVVKGEGTPAYLPTPDDDKEDGKSTKTVEDAAPMQSDEESAPAEENAQQDE